LDILGAMGPAAQDAIPAITALKDDPDVGSATLKTIALIQPQVP
jgi:hypothetical protein